MCLNGQKGTGKTGRRWPGMDFLVQVFASRILTVVFLKLNDLGSAFGLVDSSTDPSAEVQIRLETGIELGIYWHLQVISIQHRFSLKNRLSHILRTSLTLIRDLVKLCLPKILQTGQSYVIDKLPCPRSDSALSNPLSQRYFVKADEGSKCWIDTGSPKASGTQAKKSHGRWLKERVDVSLRCSSSDGGVIRIISRVPLSVLPLELLWDRLRRNDSGTHGRY